MVLEYRFIIIKNNVEYLIALLAFQCFQISLAFKMFPVWDFLVGIFPQKAIINISQILLTLSCYHLNKKIGKNRFLYFQH